MLISERLFFLMLIIFNLIGCRKVEDAAIIGSYESDKFVSKVALAEFESTTLRLFDDYRFRLDEMDTTLIEGKWKILESQYNEGYSGQQEPQATVEFTFNNKKVVGNFRGSIFYFSDANTFQHEIYRQILYVKRFNK